MNYPKIAKEKNKAYLYEDFSLGIGDERSVLSGVSNFYCSDGRLITRKGLSTGEDDVLHTTLSAQSANFLLTDSTIFLGGEYYRVAVVKESDEMSYVEYKFLFIGHNSEKREAGSIRFSRVSSSQFTVPSTPVIFTGKATKGSGIYAVFNTNRQDEESVIRIYELDHDMQKWNIIDREETYIPDYYINGRGVMYRESSETYPTPQFKEPINMLNPKFNCYYTSDGISDAFCLPIKRMSLSKKDGVNIELSLPNGKKYNWEIGGGEWVSDEVLIDEYSVFATLNPLSGNILFMSTPNGYIPPKSEGLTNNLKITLRINNAESDKKIAGMQTALWYGTGNSGSRLCVTGNRDYPSLVCISEKDEPLYFPESNQFFIGDPSQRVTALARQNKSIIMFKEKEIYSAYYTSGNFAITNIHTSIGCDLPETVALCDNRLVWTNRGGQVYMLSSLSQYSAASVYKLSNNIANILAGDSAIENAMACACTDNDKYIIFAENRAYVMDYRKAIKQSANAFVNAASWYVWELPQPVKVVAAFSSSEGLALICRADARTTSCHYLARLDASSNDTFFIAGNNEFMPNKAPITGKIETVLLDGDTPEINKLFTDVYLRFFAREDVQVSYESVDGDILKTAVINIEYNGKNESRAYRMLPLIRTPELRMNISFLGEARFDGIVFYINKLSKIK